METAELTKAEVQEVSEHSRSLEPPSTPREHFEQFASGVIKHAKAEAKEKPQSAESKPFDLSKANAEQRREWNETGSVTPKAETKKESSESEVRAEHKTTAAREQTNETPTIEPRIKELGQRAWTQQLQGKDLEDYRGHVDRQAQSGLDFVAKHKQSEQIQTGLRNLFAGYHPAMFSDFALALSEVSNPGAVLAEVGLDRVARSVITSVRTRQEMRSAVWGLAHELQQKAKAEKPSEPRPRAPRPPARSVAVGLFQNVRT